MEIDRDLVVILRFLWIFLGIIWDVLGVSWSFIGIEWWFTGILWDQIDCNGISLGSDGGWYTMMGNGFVLNIGYTRRFHQTWRAGKWTIEIGDFPINTSIQFGDFPASHVWLHLITGGYLQSLEVPGFSQDRWKMIWTWWNLTNNYWTDGKRIGWKYFEYG